MRHVLIISFDIIRNSDPPSSLAIGSLLSFLKNDKRYDVSFIVKHISFNLYQESPLSIDKIVNVIESEHDLSQLDSIALSCYVWSEYLINKLIVRLRERGFQNKIILGGYQISYYENIEKNYPDCQFFIFGDGEESFLEAILSDAEDSKRLNKIVDVTKLPSPYLTGEISVSEGQKKVRLETKRGCIFKCYFCAHKDLIRKSISYFPLHKVYKEISLFKIRKVEKINIVDPTFNIGNNYLDILKYCDQIGIGSTISLQVRLENIRDINGDRFLELCGSLNVVLEFGLQTIHPEEMAVLNRQNDLSHIKKVMQQLNRRNIAYEASLIYGIPYQTAETFESSIEFLKMHGCKVIKAYPLMLLKGTELWKQRAKWKCEETIQGKYLMLYVTSTNTFAMKDWERMKEIADSLKDKHSEE